MRHRVKIRIESEAGRPPGKDVLLEMLNRSRESLQAGIAVEAAVMAESLNPEWRATARRILGIWDSPLEPELEARALSMRKAVEGDPDTLYALAKEMLTEGDDGLDESMEALATTLLCMQSIVSIKQHAIEPSAWPGESELVWMLETLGPTVAEAVGEDLELIARKSPFRSVKEAAKALLESR